MELDFLLWIVAAGIVFLAAGTATKVAMKSENSDGISWACFAAGVAMLFVAMTVFGVATAPQAFGRDLAGRYAASPLKPWFDGLKSGRGPCCSDADGTALKDVDWESAGGHYRVRIDDQWFDVPDDAVLTEPNRAGVAMVWPMRGYNGVSIRCFIAGSGA